MMQVIQQILLNINIWKTVNRQSSTDNIRFTEENEESNEKHIFP